MRELTRPAEQQRREQVAPKPASAPGAPARRPGPSPTRALALQRSAGNRATSRLLARWIKHPDAEQKGVMVPDSVAADFTHFNPPKNE
jgi:hypothetical protein